MDRRLSREGKRKEIDLDLEKGIDLDLEKGLDLDLDDRKEGCGSVARVIAPVPPPKL